MKHFKIISFILLGGVGMAILSGCSLKDNKITQVASEISWPKRSYNDNVDVGIKSDGTYTPTESDMVKGSDFLRDNSTGELSDEERDGLIRMREEEKLARDVYLTLALQWQESIFENIANSEQTHTNAVRMLIERHGVSDPVMDDSVGVFASPDMQKLYDDFIVQGKQSVGEAYKVGAAIEELDIHDLNELMAKTDNDDIKAVYGTLSRGSRNHLRVFVRQVYNKKETYEPKYISEKEYDEIISSPQEKGKDE